MSAPVPAKEVFDEVRDVFQRGFEAGADGV